MMFRHLSVALAALALLVLVGCAGPGSGTGKFTKKAALGNLTVTQGTAHGSGTITNVSVPLGTTGDVPMLQVQMSADGTEDIEVTSFSLTGSGSGDEVSDLATTGGVDCYLDVNNDGTLDVGDSLLVENTYIMNNGTVNLNVSQLITAGATVNFLILYDFSTGLGAAGGDNFLVSLDPVSITATGQTSLQSPIVTGTTVTGATATIVGTLTIGEDGATQPSDQNVSNSAADLGVLQLELTADGAEDLTVTSLTLTALGQASDMDESSDVTSALLALDQNGDGLYQPLTDGTILNGPSPPFGANNGTLTFTGFNQQITAGTSQKWLVVYTISNAGGQSFALTLANDTDIAGTGTGSSAQFFRTLNTITPAVFSTIVTGVLTVSVGTVAPPSGNTDIPEGSTNQKVLEINLAASAYEDITIDSITFTHTGTGVIDNGGTPPPEQDLAASAPVTLYNEDTAAVITTTATITATTITFSGLSQLIDVSVDTDVNWGVYYDFASGLTSSGGHTFRLAVAGGADVSASGATSSGFGVTIHGTLSAGSPPQGPNPTLTLVETLEIKHGSFHPADTGLGNPPIASPGPVAEIMQLELNAYCDSVRVTSVTLHPSGSGDDANHISSVVWYVDVNNNGLVDTGTDTQIASGTYPSDDSQQTFTFSTSQTVAPGTPLYLVVEYQMAYYAASPAAAGDGYTCEIQSTGVVANGLGSLKSITHTVGTPPGTTNIPGAILSYGSTLNVAYAGGTQGTEQRGNTNVLMLGFTLNEGQSLDTINFTDLVITAAGGTAVNTVAKPYLNQHITAVRLYEDDGDGMFQGAGTDSLIGGPSTYTVGSTTITFSSLGSTISPGGTNYYWITYDFHATNPWVGCTYAVEINQAADITATGTSYGNPTVSATSWPVKGGYKLMDGVWSLITSSSTNWPTWHQGYGIYSQGMVFCPNRGTGSAGSLVVTGGLAHDFVQGNQIIGQYVMEYDLGGAGTWTAHGATGSWPGGANSVGHTYGTLVWVNISGTDYVVWYGGKYLDSVNGMTLSNNVNLYDLSTFTWSLLSVSAGGPAQGRVLPGFGTDQTGTNPVVYIWGGSNDYWSSAGTFYNDAYTLTLTSATNGTWAAISNPTGTIPSVRQCPGSGVDTAATSPTLLISGGEDTTLVGTTSSWNLYQTGGMLANGTTPGYTALTNNVEMSSRFAHAWDQENRVLFLFGGAFFNGATSTYQGHEDMEVHVPGCPTAAGVPTKWNIDYATATTSPGPPNSATLSHGLASSGTGRTHMGGAWDSVGKRFLMFGGMDQGANTNGYNLADMELWQLK